MRISDWSSDVCSSDLVSSWGIEVADLCIDVVVSGNEVTTTGAQGIAITGNTNGPPQRITVQGNVVRAAGDNGIRVTKGTASSGPVGLAITGNVVHGSTDRGIEDRKSTRLNSSH